MKHAKHSSGRAFKIVAYTVCVLLTILSLIYEMACC